MTWSCWRWRSSSTRGSAVVAYLNDHVARTRPTLGLALSLADRNPATPRSSPSAIGRCCAIRLIELEGDGPLPGRGIKLASDLVERLATVSTRRSLPPWLALCESDQGLLDR
jgi:hypothetical protein